jgi:hypothetical protein
MALKRPMFPSVDGSIDQPTERVGDNGAECDATDNEGDFECDGRGGECPIYGDLLPISVSLKWVSLAGGAVSR